MPSAALPDAVANLRWLSRLEEDTAAAPAALTAAGYALRLAGPVRGLAAEARALEELLEP